MPNQATVTAKCGPNRQVTAVVVRDVVKANFDFARQMVQFETVTASGNQLREYDLTGITTITCAVSGTSYTWVLS
jgi:hypothetical protein